LNGDRNNIVKNIERGLGSKGKLRILRALAKEPQKPLSIYMLEKYTGIRSNFLKADIKTLMEIGWVKEYTESGRIKKYSLNLRNETVLKIIEFFRSINYL